MSKRVVKAKIDRARTRDNAVQAVNDGLLGMVSRCLEFAFHLMGYTTLKDGTADDQLDYFAIRNHIQDAQAVLKRRQDHFTPPGNPKEPS